MRDVDEGAVQQTGLEYDRADQCGEGEAATPARVHGGLGEACGTQFLLPQRVLGSYQFSKRFRTNRSG